MLRWPAKAAISWMSQPARARSVRQRWRNVGIERVVGQAAMGLEGEPGVGMRIGCNRWTAIPTDRVDDKIRRQTNLLLEVPEEQMAGWPRITRSAR
jgi:hypothetical protein